MTAMLTINLTMYPATMLIDFAPEEIRALLSLCDANSDRPSHTLTAADAKLRDALAQSDAALQSLLTASAPQALRGEGRDNTVFGKSGMADN